MAKWTVEDEQYLKDLVNLGFGNTRISQILRRSYKSIICKKHILQLRSPQCQITEVCVCKLCRNIKIDHKSAGRKFCSNNCSASATNRTRELPWKEAKCSKCNNICKVKCTHVKNTCDECKMKRSKELLLLRKGNTIRKCVSCENLVDFKKQYCSDCKYVYYHVYRPNCEFNFNLADFPEEFNMKLVGELGWYSPTNRNDNLEGVCRDHMFSVRQGFVDGVDPEMIKHPANCKLMTHPENSSKKTKCSIGLSELQGRIVCWEERYGKWTG